MKHHENAKNIWRHTSERLSLMISIILVLLIQQLWDRSTGARSTDLPLIFTIVLFLLNTMDWWSLKYRRCEWALAYMVPLAALATVLVAIWNYSPHAAAWLPIAMLYLFLRVNRKVAQIISIAMLAIVILILGQHWHAETAIITRAFFINILCICILSMYFSASQRVSEELEQTNLQLNEVLKDFLNLRQSELKRTREQMVNALSKLALYRDYETGQHVLRTQMYVKALAQNLVRLGHYRQELSDENIELIFKATPMHDLGKVGIPDYILNKPGNHTAEEIELMRTHAIIGEKTLLIAAQDQNADSSILMVAASIAGGHHENWDGSGYPRGLKGREIPLAARLMALADVYDALTTRRVYKPSWSHEDSAAEIYQLSGKKFDPLIIEAFRRSESEFLEILEKFKDQE